MCVLSCLTLCNPMDYSPPGSSVHGVLQARILEWVVISSRGSSQSKDRTRISCLSSIGRQMLFHWATWKTGHRGAGLISQASPSLCEQSPVLLSPCHWLLSVSVWRINGIFTTRINGVILFLPLDPFIKRTEQKENKTKLFQNWELSNPLSCE